MVFRWRVLLVRTVPARSDGTCSFGRYRLVRTVHARSDGSCSCGGDPTPTQLGPWPSPGWQYVQAKPGRALATREACNTNILQGWAIFTGFLSKGTEQRPKHRCQWAQWPWHRGGRYRCQGSVRLSWRVKHESFFWNAQILRLRLSLTLTLSLTLRLLPDVAQKLDFWWFLLAFDGF